MRKHRHESVRPPDYLAKRVSDVVWSFSADATNEILSWKYVDHIFAGLHENVLNIFDLIGK